MTSPPLIHGVGVAVALDPDGPLAGALLLGAPGAGKSSTALALIEQCPWRRTALAADDAVIISEHAGELSMSGPERISGLIEVRGFGPTRVRSIDTCRLLAAFDLSKSASRLPDPARFPAADDGSLTIPLWPFQHNEMAAIRIRTMLAAILAGQKISVEQDSNQEH